MPDGRIAVQGHGRASRDEKYGQDCADNSQHAWYRPVKGQNMVLKTVLDHSFF
jgi:hypothetical protein